MRKLIYSPGVSLGGMRIGLELGETRTFGSRVVCLRLPTCVIAVGSSRSPFRVVWAFRGLYRAVFRATIL
jgi:hypothetical protein